jgi:predicted enzyme related to lactoylglutathione lyase
MKRVTGIGGIFLKAQDPERLREWYRSHLGIEIESWGGAKFRSQEREGVTIWSIFPSSSTYFDPSSAAFMINYRVENLDALLEALRGEGCTVDERTEASEFGKFGWVMDPEGNRIELWEAPPESSTG